MSSFTYDSIVNIFWPKYSPSADSQMILVDFPYMLSLTNMSDIKLFNTPKMAFFAKFHKNQQVAGNLRIEHN